MFSQLGAAALGARDHVVDGEARAGAAVLALQPSRANTARRVILRLCVSRGIAHVGHEADDDRPWQRAVCPVQVWRRPR